jgi:DNA topoisomerase-1
VSKLVIVESPTKARTIERYLGKGFKVLSSMGHVRDLPQRELAVDIEGDFEPKLIVTNKKAVTQLKKAVADAEAVYLATDNDREGEAIAYDLYEVLEPKHKKKYLRVVFNEITKRVILEAIEQPTEIDLKKVEAQRARRILDRLVGYLISPLLSKTLSGSKYQGLSAGRVQSVALKFICDRELEIQAFVPEEYWTMDAKLVDGSEFLARLERYQEKKLKIPTQTEAERIRQELQTIAQSSGLFVKGVEEEESRRSPPPPFITSTLQQAASSMLKFAPRRTMQVAQQLYEGIELEAGNEGLITYMRTDSLRVSDAARKDLRAFIHSQLGENYLSDKERIFKNKKAAQDAHEAIRPTDVERTPDSVKPHLSAEQYKIYKLIWERFVATQMAEALYHKKTVDVSAGEYLLVAKGSRLVFDGFLKIWKLPPLKDEGVEIPGLKEGERVSLLDILSEQHFTEPPNRYSEASLVKALEEKGIGRPSTYAAIVSTIQERGYTYKEKGGALRPTLLGFIATDFLKDYFPLTVAEEFTAHMEEELDKISNGELTRVQVLQEFYAPLSKRLDQVKSELSQEAPTFHIKTDVSCPNCGALMKVRFWKGSVFLSCSRYPECKTTVNFPENIEYVYRSKQLEIQQQLKAYQQEKREIQSEAPEHPCPNCGAPMELREGKFGRFYGCSRYPECKTTMPLTTGVPCPLCGRDLVERYSKKTRKPFYGCQGYPECKFAVNERPVKLCSKCGQGVLVRRESEEGETLLVCSNKECDHREASEPSTAAASTQS